LSSAPAQYPDSAAAAKLPNDGTKGWHRTFVRRNVEKFFGTPAQPTLWGMRDYIGGDPETGYTEHLQVGRDLFKKHCLHCHGLHGRGDGPTAEFLNPLPRNFWRGKFKFKSTELPAKPTRDDLIRTITYGVHGTAMPSFMILDDKDLGVTVIAEQRDDYTMRKTFEKTTVAEYLADYVIYLAMLGEVSNNVADSAALMTGTDKEVQNEIAGEFQALYSETADKWRLAGQKVIPIPVKRTPMSEASIARGRKLFLEAKNQCVECHQRDAKGGTERVGADLITQWREKGTWETHPNNENLPNPRNITLGQFRGGRRPVDLYRLLVAGIEPMPSLGGALTPAQRWDLVNYILSVPKRGAFVPGVDAEAGAQGK
jgi:mono/diheme cytochrome c family protein